MSPVRSSWDGNVSSWLWFQPHSSPVPPPLLLLPCLFHTRWHPLLYFFCSPLTPLPTTTTTTHAHTHTYVHMHHWLDVEYVNRHLLQYPISSPHHVSDMLMQPTQFLHSTSSPPSPFTPLPLLSVGLPEPAKDEQMRQRSGGRRERERESGGDLQTKPDNDVVMDGCYTQTGIWATARSCCLLENNGWESRREMPRCGWKDKASAPLALLLPLPR